MKTCLQISRLLFSLAVTVNLSWSAAAQTSGPPITNLRQLNQLLERNQSATRDLRLEAIVCAASDPSIGVVILADETSAAAIELRSGGQPELVPGDRIRINRAACFLRRSKMGVQLSAVPLVTNDGIHARRTNPGTITLKKGRHLFTLEWFNRTHVPSLEVKWQISGSQPEDIPGTNLFSPVTTNATQRALQAGLLAECFEGDWERVPNFDLLTPVRTCIVSNFNPDIATREEFVGIRFRGEIEVPVDGTYRFSTRSADGSLLFLNDPVLFITKLGTGVIPAPGAAAVGGPAPTREGKAWVAVEGRVSRFSRSGRGAELELAQQRNSLLVRVADVNALNSSDLLNSRVRITGFGVNHFAPDGEAFLGEVVAMDHRSVQILQNGNEETNAPSTLLLAEQVRKMSLEDASRKQPVILRGIVTSKGRPQDHWISVQDSTRGVFVSLRNPSNAIPSCGDFYEVVGRSDAGNFAPIVAAEQISRLGEGQFPEPLRPGWDELNNGSMDVQWVEFSGLVTAVQTNTLSMLLPGGPMEVQIEGPPPWALKPLLKAMVSVRGVAFAVWNSIREVRIGSITIRNAQITVKMPAPDDPFDAVVKTPRELLLFDAQANPFRRVKVTGVVTYSDPKHSFLEDGGKGLRLLPAESSDARTGDLIEAVGYPYISRNAILLREAVMRTIAKTNVPPARELSEPLPEEQALDSTRIRMEAVLLGMHMEEGRRVLEMQSGNHLFLARLSDASDPSLRIGSRLSLAGVYVTHIRNLRDEAGGRSFELLLNTAKDITVLSQPSWWTLKKVSVLAGSLAAILVFSSIWISQLHRLVEQRTAQLRAEMRQREIAEQQRALEAERSRIARDLHDDLGASLTEITMLATNGQHNQSLERNIATLFRNISSKAREMVAAMDIIVWAVNPKDNSLQSVADYLCDFTDEYFSHSDLACRFDVPVALPPIVLEGRIRHDLVLAVKETLNNIIRHAHASRVVLRLTFNEDSLEIEISDNGKGFDMQTPRRGNGLKHLPERLSRIGGHYDVASTVGKGTVVKIGLKLPVSEKSGF